MKSFQISRGLVYLVGSLSVVACAPAAEESVAAEPVAMEPVAAQEEQASVGTDLLDTTTNVIIKVYAAYPDSLDPCALSVDPPMAHAGKTADPKSVTWTWAGDQNGYNHVKLKSKGGTDNYQCFSDSNNGFNLDYGAANKKKKDVLNVDTCVVTKTWYYTVKAFWRADEVADTRDCIYDPGVIIDN